MLPRGGDVVPRRKFLDQLNVRGQARARESSLEQIVAEQRVVGDAARERGLEDVNLVNPLAAVGAFVEQVLVNVGHGERIRIDSGGAREYALEYRALAPGRQRRGNPRLKNAMTLDDATKVRVEAGSIQRMRHLADHLARSSARQTRVGVKRDHVAHAVGDFRRAPVLAKKGGGGRAAQQTIQLVQLAALALPSHPAAFGFIPDAPAMKQDESLASRTRRVR